MLSTRKLLNPLNMLWYSNASWVPTGYGSQTRINAWALKDLGYDIVVAAYFGLGGAPKADTHGIMHLPSVRDQFLNDVIAGYFNAASTYYVNHQKTDLVFSLVDIFAMNPALHIWKTMPWAAWVPIDCEPILQNEMDAFEVVRFPIAMSRHGEDQMKQIGLSPFYVPHGIETDIFKPIDRIKARHALYEDHLIPQPIPDDAFLVVIVGNNGMDDRKNWSGMFEAFQLFSLTHPNSVLYVHAEANGIHGKPLTEMVKQLAIADKTIFPQSIAMAAGMVSDTHLRNVYNAADVKLMLSAGEGFGLTDVEAQACGCPIVATNFSASIELNFTGWKVDGVKRQTRVMSYQLLADPAHAASCLADARDVYEAGAMPELRARTRTAALDYDIARTLEQYMIPTLERIAADLKQTPHAKWLRDRETPPVSRQVARAMARKRAKAGGK